jgi:hypothetical protein
MSSTLQVPVFALTVLGVLVAVLGLFAAGEIAMVALGLAAVAFGGLLAAVGARRS